MAEPLTDEEIVALLREVETGEIPTLADDARIAATLALVPVLRAGLASLARNRPAGTSPEVAEALAKVAEEKRLVDTVLEALRLGQPLRTAPLVRVLAISEGRALRLLSKMQRQGLIVSRPASRPGPGSHQALVWALADGSKP